MNVDQRLMEDLYVEASAVAEVFENLAGAAPTKLTGRLIRLAEQLLEQGFGVVDEGEKERWWATTRARADELMGRTAEQPAAA